MSWTNKQTLFLICLYRKAPELYNPQHLFYSKLERKQIALDRIVQEMNAVRPNTTVVEVIQKITSMRLLFNRQFKSYQNTHGIDGGTNTLWCFGSLLFLGEFVNDCPSLLRTFQSNCGRCQDEEYLSRNDINPVAEGAENNATLEAINRRLNQMVKPTDRWDTFGKFIAAEIRQMKSEHSRNKAKRLIVDALQTAQDEDRS